jgi:hypothetical protein
MSPEAGWLLQEKVVPRLRSAIPVAVHCVGCEDPEELVQDGTAIAARMLHNAEAAGKQVTAGNIAYYAIQHLKSGRRSTGSSVVDVMQPATQVSGRTQVVSLEALVPTEGADNETFTLGDALSNDHEDPAMIATRRLDWDSFCESQSLRNRAILECTVAGEPLTDLARRHRVSRSSVQANKNALAREIKAFMGQDILQETARQPLWKHNLAANRERFAWRKGANQEEALR